MQRTHQEDLQPIEVPTLFTVAQAAELMQISNSLLYALIEKRKIRHHRLGVGHGAIRISQQDIHEFLDSTTVGIRRKSVVEKKTKSRSQNVRHLRQKRNPK